MYVLKRIWSIIICLFRLLIVVITAVFTALNKIFFDHMEVISMTLVIRPQALERSTMSFIDNLRYENIELTKGASIPKQDAFDDNDPFMPDDMLDEYGDELDFDGDSEEGIFEEDKDSPTEDVGPLIEMEPEEKPKKKRGRKKKDDTQNGNEGQDDTGS